MNKPTNTEPERGRGTNRRKFLNQTLAAGALTIVTPQAVRTAAANSKIRLGIVGLGSRGAWLTNFFATHGAYQVNAVADYFPQVAQTVGARFNVPQPNRFSGLMGYRRLIESGAVDAIALETPPYFFPEHAREAIDAGLHTYMAKPVAVDAPGCRLISALNKNAQKNKQVFLVDFQTRTDPHFQEVIRRLHNGDLEKVVALRSYYTDEGFADPPMTENIESRLQRLVWVNDVALGGSYCVNAAIHAIDVALWAADALPIRAMGISEIRRPDPHGDSRDVYSVTFEFPDGLICNHRSEHVKNMSGFTCGCWAYGVGGFMETNYNGKVWMRGGKNPYRGGELSNLYPDGAKSNVDTFAKAIQAGDTSNPTIEPSVNSTMVSILARECARRKTILTYDEIAASDESQTVNLSGLKE